MSDCGRFAESLRALVAGDPVPAAPALRRHAEDCPDCRELLCAHETLRELATEITAQVPADLEAMRRRVLEPLVRGRRPPRFAAFARLRPLAAALGGVILFAAGFAASWISIAGDTEKATLLGELNAEAVSNRSLGDVEESPFTYSDVTFRRVEGDRVALDFDVTRHVRVTETARSPLVQEILAQALLNPSHTGSRLKALSLAAGGMAPKVRQSLIFALHHDENLAVRSKALAILAAQPADPAIEAAVLATLRADEAVQMRLEALDYLATHLDPAAIRRAIGDADAAGNAALMVRLREYEK